LLVRICVFYECPCWSNVTEFPLKQWFFENYQALGFTEIIGEYEYGFLEKKEEMKFRGRPDFLVLKDEKWLRLEVESFSSKFNHSRDYADLVLCYDNDHDLGIPTISLKEFYECDLIMSDVDVRCKYGVNCKLSWNELVRIVETTYERLEELRNEWSLIVTERLWRDRLW